MFPNLYTVTSILFPGYLVLHFNVFSQNLYSVTESYSRISRLEREEIQLELLVPLQRHSEPVVFPDLLHEYLLMLPLLHGEPCLQLRRLTDIVIGRGYV